MLQHYLRIMQLCPLICFAFLTGCTTINDIKAVRDLPVQSHPESGVKFIYDPAVDAYRYPSNRDSSQVWKGPVVRSSSGRKIRVQPDLERQIAFSQRNPTGFGKSAAFYSTLAVSLPGAIAGEVVGTVTGVPFALYLNSVQSKLTSLAEKSYVAGRKMLQEGNYEGSINEFAYATYIIPSLLAYSDVDYWRGQALVKLNRNEEAQQSFTDFIDYSESAVPEWFEEKFPKDPEFPAKIAEAKQINEALLLWLAKKKSEAIGSAPTAK